MKQLAQVMPESERRGFRTKLEALPPDRSAAMAVYDDMKPFLRAMNQRQREISLSLFSIVFIGETAATPAVLRRGKEIAGEVKGETEASGKATTAAFLIAESAKELHREETFTSNAVQLEKEILLVDTDIAETCRSALRTLFGKSGRSLAGLDIIEVLPQGIEDEKFFAEIADIAKKWQYFREMDITDAEFFDTMRFLRGLG
ncbi:MAG: hypothetical protein AB1324_01170 [Candidatus Micrarchaeota archaeon]